MHQLPTWTSLTLLLALGPRAVPVRAEIPPEKAVGVYAHTRPERLAQSPFWGMAALKSGVLANIRFFGAYGSTPVAGLPPHPQLELQPPAGPPEARPPAKPRKAAP